MSQKAKTIYRIICCYSDPLILRNFDKISDIATSFSLVFARDSEPDASIINHRNDDVCPWSQKIIDLLSDVQVSGDVKRKNEALINHLMTIKKFYSTYRMKKMNKLHKLSYIFEIVQTYETILSLAFHIFQRNPNTMSDIDKLLENFETIFKDYNNNCIRFVERIANRGMFRNIDNLTLELNSKFGEYDLLLVSDYIKDLGEFMCIYKNISLKDTQFLARISELITETALLIHDKINEAKANFDQPLTRRYPKSNLLSITKKIDKNLFKFESKELVLRKVYFSFEQIYKSLAKVNQDLNDINDQKQTNEINFRNANTSWTENVKQELSFTQTLVEDLETIMFFMVFYFENQEIILYPLSGHLDEISRMLEKYLSYHLVFRITYGKNYLNQIKSTINQIIKLFEDDLVEIKSVTFVLNELKRRYLDTVFLDDVEFLRKPNLPKPQLMVEVEPEINYIFDLIMDELKPL